jgi:hypothetical protein
MRPSSWPRRLIANGTRLSAACARRRFAGIATHRLAGIVITAGLVGACASGPAPRIVDGWSIGQAVSCADLGIDRAGCDRVVETADAFADARGATTPWTIHAALPVDAAGSPRLLALGSGVPDGVLVVRVPDGTEEVALIGCFQAISPGDPPGCP